MRAWGKGEDFRARLMADPDIRARLSEAELDDAFNLDRHFRHVDRTFREVGL